MEENSNSFNSSELICPASDSNSTNNCSVKTFMSKRALKKQRKRQEWLDTRKERREKEKLKRKSKIEKRKQENPNLPSYSASRKILKKSASEKEKSQVHVVFDFSFGQLMNQRDRGKCLKQLLRCYSMNRRFDHPLNLHISSFGGQMKEEMSRHDGYENWDVKFFDDSYISAFERGEINPLSTEKKNIVYLTSESDNILEQFEADKAYVIGGIVDHNLHKGLCYKLANEAGVSHAQLPLEKYVQMKTRKVLTIDHVFQIIGKVVSQKKTWTDAILNTLPLRKEVEVKETENNEFSGEVSSCIASIPSETSEQIDMK